MIIILPFRVRFLRDQLLRIFSSESILAVMLSLYLAIGSSVRWLPQILSLSVVRRLILASR